MMQENKPCEYCGIKPSLFDDGTYYESESIKIVVESPFSTMCIGAEADGKIFMSAYGDDETEHYYPKFCPECGRRLADTLD